MTQTINGRTLTKTAIRNLLNKHKSILRSPGISLLGGNWPYLIDLGNDQFLLAIKTIDGNIPVWGLMTGDSVDELREALSEINPNDYAYPCAYSDGLELCYFRSDVDYDKELEQLERQAGIAYRY